MKPDVVSVAKLKWVNLSGHTVDKQQVLQNSHSKRCFCVNHTTIVLARLFLLEWKVQKASTDSADSKYVLVSC